jgi:membrane AbrB-like protein
MTRQPDPHRSNLLGRLPPAAQWALLVAGSIALAVLLEVARPPAALLLGPMLAGILLAAAGARIRAPTVPVAAAQTVVGCLIARSITGDIVLAFLRDWPLLLGVVLAMVATSGLLGWAISRFKVLPGTTAVWGSRPAPPRP